MDIFLISSKKWTIYQIFPFLIVCDRTVDTNNIPYEVENSNHLDKIRDKASSMVNHNESTIERQSTAVFPVHLTGE